MARATTAAPVERARSAKDPASFTGKGVRGLMSMRRFLKHNVFDVVNTHSSTDSWLAALACAGVYAVRAGFERERVHSGAIVGERGSGDLRQPPGRVFPPRAIQSSASRREAEGATARRAGPMGQA